MTYSPGDEERERAVRSETGRALFRGLFMLIVIFCFGIAQGLLYAMALVQFLWILLAQERNRFLADFGRSLGLWLAEAAWFLSGDTEEKPFPWRAWPRGE